MVNRSVQPFLCTPLQRLPMLFNGWTTTKNCPFPLRDWGPHVIMVHWAYSSQPPNGISISSAVFAGLTNMINRPKTDWPCYSVCSNRSLYLATAMMQTIRITEWAMEWLHNARNVTDKQKNERIKLPQHRPWALQSMSNKSNMKLTLVALRSLLKTIKQLRRIYTPHSWCNCAVTKDVNTFSLCVSCSQSLNCTSLLSSYGVKCPRQRWM